MEDAVALAENVHRHDALELALSPMNSSAELKCGLPKVRPGSATSGSEPFPLHRP